MSFKTDQQQNGHDLAKVNQAQGRRNKHGKSNSLAVNSNAQSNNGRKINVLTQYDN